LKALYTTAPGQYGLTERPMPEPAPDEALVKVTSAAICHTDVIIRAGKAGHVMYPVIPGHEFSGVVEACGANVKYLRPGARVAAHTMMGCGLCAACRRGDAGGCEYYDELGSKRDGGFAEYCTIPSRYLFQLPENVTLAEGALVEPLANAVSATRQAQIKQGDRVVIIGPGPIGLLAVQIARLSHPSSVILVGTRESRLAVGAGLGATRTFNLRRPGAIEELQATLGRKGADVVIECAGNRSALDLAMQLAGWRARIAVEGVYDVEEQVPISPYSLLLARAVSLIGINGWSTADFMQALELLRQGLVDVKPLITHTCAFADWEEAFDLVTHRKDDALKVELAF
jgi:2-desacetyl-2-hydroxyethyl bacteriochlorophyllide A dehydrogenase